MNTQNKTDLTECTERELYLQVYNTEDLWLARHKTNLIELINSRFKFTNKQYEFLCEALQNEYEAEEN